MKARLFLVRDRVFRILRDWKQHSQSFSRSEKAFWAVVFAALGVLFLTILQLAGQGNSVSAENRPTELRVLATMDTTKDYTFPEIKEVPQEIHDSESDDGYITVPKSALRIPTTTAEKAFEVEEEPEESTPTTSTPPKSTAPETTSPTTTSAPRLIVPPLPVPTTQPVELPQPPATES